MRTHCTNETVKIVWYLGFRESGTANPIAESRMTTSLIIFEGPKACLAIKNFFKKIFFFAYSTRITLSAKCYQSFPSS